MFEKLRNHQIALLALQEAERRFVFVLDRYEVYKLRMSITTWVKHMNTESYHGKLELETALQIEDEMSAIKSKIKNVLHQNCAFWELL